MKNLAHSASFHCMENIAPSKPGIKHLEDTLHLVWMVPDLFKTLISDFETAIEMFDYAYPKMKAAFGNASTEPDHQSIQKWLRWMGVAGRDGAQTIFHSVKLIRETGSITLRKCPTLNAHISRSKRNYCNELIRLHFRDWEDLRDAVAHRVEFQQSLERKALHSPDNERHYGQGGWTSRTFKVHNKKKTLQYELSETTQQNLTQIREAFCDLFREE